MADQNQFPAVEDEGEEEVVHCMYMGGRASRSLQITHAQIHNSVTTIHDWAFWNKKSLVHVGMHSKVERIGVGAFNNTAITSIDLKGVLSIHIGAFFRCEKLNNLQSCDELETIGHCAFDGCISLRILVLKSTRTIGYGAFHGCKELNEVEFGEKLDRIEAGALKDCSKLQRLKLPMKADLFEDKSYPGLYNQFDGCMLLSTVELDRATHKTISSLHLETWRNDMNQEINRINQTLPATPVEAKTNEIRCWIQDVANKLKHYKSRHHIILEEVATCIDLALWSLSLGNVDDKSNVNSQTRHTRSGRQEQRTTSGASIVISNVIPFLELV